MTEFTLRDVDFPEGYVAVIDKPYEWTSADVVRKIKFQLRKCGHPKIKIGHAGTLDPLATGILLVCIGRATKQVEKLQAELEKEREHNREKDKQLLETLNKLAESQAALSAGQAADKQKALAEKIIEGNKQLSDEALASEKSQHFLRKIFCRKKK